MGIEHAGQVGDDGSEYGLAYPDQLRKGILAQIGPKAFRKIVAVEAGMFPDQTDLTYVGPGGLTYSVTVPAGIRIPWMTPAHGDELIAEAIEAEVAHLRDRAEDREAA